MLFGLFLSEISGQIINSYGLKVGFTSSWQNEFIGGEKLNGLDNKSSINVGFYAEWFKSSWYSINTELNFSQKGVKTEIPFTSIEYPDGTGEYLRSNMRLNYLSISILPNIYTEIEKVRFYAFTGPRIDIELSKSIYVSGPEPYRTYYSSGFEKNFDNYKSLQFGFTIGLGFQLKELFPFSIGLEARYNPDISKVYETKNAYIKNNSMDFLLTIGL
jgi:hypothetical protein